MPASLVNIIAVNGKLIKSFGIGQHSEKVTINQVNSEVIYTFGQNHMDVTFQCFIDFSEQEYKYYSIQDATSTKS